MKSIVVDIKTHTLYTKQQQQNEKYKIINKCFFLKFNNL